MSQASPADPKIVVALDYDDAGDALKLAKQLSPEMCRLKVGKELFTSCGPSVVESLQALGFDIFLDLKFHDIPNTVAKAVKTAANLGVWMVNVHASGGQPMMEAAKEALAGFGDDRPLLIAVTVLTSMSQEQLNSAGVQGDLQAQVARLAGLVDQSGLDGVVCSAKEVELLRSQITRDFTLVTPGIRPKWAASNDQHRIVTPADAITMGSDYLVIGRPITQSENPLESLERIVAEL